MKVYATKTKVFAVVTLGLAIVILALCSVAYGEGTGLFVAAVAAGCILLYLDIRLWIIAEKRGAKCPECKKMGAMKIYDMDVFDYNATQSGSKTVYKCYRKCKYCGAEEVVHRTKRSLN